MKSNYFFSALAIVCVLAFSACHEDVNTPYDSNPLMKFPTRHPDSAQVFIINANGTERYDHTIFYQYDAAGNTISELTPSLKIEQRFDANNNLLEYRKYHYNTQMQTWRGEVKLYYTYDNNKRQTVTMYTDFKDTLETPIYKKGDYTWYDDKHSKCMIYRQWEINKFILGEFTEESFDSKGRLLEEKYTLCKPDSTPTNTHFEISYTYDRHGNPATYYYIAYYYNESSFSQKDTYRYIYDKGGNMLIKWLTSTTFRDNSQKNTTTTIKYVYFY